MEGKKISEEELQYWWSKFPEHEIDQVEALVLQCIEKKEEAEYIELYKSENNEGI